MLSFRCHDGVVGEPAGTAATQLSKNKQTTGCVRIVIALYVLVSVRPDFPGRRIARPDGPTSSQGGHLLRHFLDEY